MTIEDTKQIVDKIKIYRPNFGGQFDKSGFDKLKLEWFRVLEPYDYDDVNRKLDEYFKNGDNFGKYPDVYYLIKYLKSHDEKIKTNGIGVRCQICGRIVSADNYDEHYDRCNSVEYLCNMSEKYFSKKLSKEKLTKASKSEFDKYYWDFCNKLYDHIDEGNILKHSLKNSILTYKGFEPEYEVEDLLRKNGAY